MTDGRVRMFKGRAAMRLRHRKRNLPADGRRDEAVLVIMVLRFRPRLGAAADRAVRRRI